MPVRPLHALLLLACAACAPQPPVQTAEASGTDEAPPPPMRATVTDLPAFDAYIATRPTPDQLRARYPGLVVVLPGEIATKELRTDNSRYFAELDPQGRVNGGRFQ